MILRLLAEKHAADVWVEECKNGSTWFGGHRRLDGWAMKRSWSPWTTIGYEIKVSRSDFRRDDKWPEYLALCHQFSLVCPAKLIALDELPPGVGLIWAVGQGSGTRLVVKRKAERHEPDERAMLGLLTYVLMSRTRIVGDMWQANRQPQTKEQQLREMVETAEANKQLAAFVRGHIQETFRKQELRLAMMERQVADAEQIKQKVQSLGIDPEAGVWVVKRRLDEVVSGLPSDLHAALRSAWSALDNACRQLDELNAGKERA